MRTSFFIKTNGLYCKVLFDDIYYIEVCKHYVTIHIVFKKHVVHCSLQHIKALLPSNQFCQIHKSYIISIDKLARFDTDAVWIESASPNDDCRQLPLSAQYVAALKSILTIVRTNGKHDEESETGKIVAM